MAKSAIEWFIEPLNDKTRNALYEKVREDETFKDPNTNVGVRPILFPVSRTIINFMKKDSEFRFHVFHRVGGGKITHWPHEGVKRVAAHA